MQISSIKYFLAVVISGSFTAAADVMYCTQSTVSKQIASLETELGVTLFDRSKRQISLTPAGEALLLHAEKLLDAYNDMLQTISEMNSNQSNQTSVASIPVMAHYGIINMISDFRRRHPNINLIVDEREAYDILRGLEDGQYEMAFMRNKGIDHSKYQQIVLCEDRLIALLPDQHALANKNSISIMDLKDENFFLLGERTGLLDFFIKTCKQHGGFTPNIGYTGIHMDSITEMVGQGMGVSLMMEVPARYVQKPNTRLVPLKEDVTSQVNIIRLRKRSPSIAGDRFWSFVRAWSNKQKEKQ